MSGSHSEITFNLKRVDEATATQPFYTEEQGEDDEYPHSSQMPRVRIFSPGRREDMSPDRRLTTSPVRLEGAAVDVERVEHSVPVDTREVVQTRGSSGDRSLRVQRESFGKQIDNRADRDITRQGYVSDDESRYSRRAIPVGRKSHTRFMGKPEDSDDGRYQRHASINTRAFTTGPSYSGHRRDDYTYERPYGAFESKSNVPTIKPEIYDGSNDWESYLSHFLNCADLGRWSEDEKALTLASRLQGPARTFYIGLPRRDQTLFHRLLQKMSDRFGSERHQTKYITKLESRKREGDEVLASFGDDLRIMSRRAYPDLDSDAQESLALHQFYKTLSPEMRYRCLDKECRTVQQAVDVVEKYELVMGRDDKRKSTTRVVKEQNEFGNRTSGNREPSLSLEEKVESIIVRLEKLESAVSQRWSQSRYSVCYNCGHQGHFARDCRNNQAQQRPSRSGNGKPLA